MQNSLQKGAGNLAGAGNGRGAVPSVFSLLRAVLVTSLWLFGRSLKMIFILHKEMLACLISGGRTEAGSGRNLFQQFGIWFVDLNGLMHEHLRLK